MSSRAPLGWLSVSEAARHFGISRATAHRLIVKGEWPTPLVLPGMRNRRFSPEQIAEIAGAAVPRSA